jgi:hypothetical protein
MQEFFIDNNAVDYAEYLMKTQDIEKHIKYYPGSAKGPHPEDDPEHYFKWFMNN